MLKEALFEQLGLNLNRPHIDFENMCFLSAEPGKKEEYCLDQFMRTKVLNFDEVQTPRVWKLESANVSLLMMGCYGT